MRLIFMGTPDFSVPSLISLAKKHEILAVYSREPQKQGRGMVLTPSPVHQKAIELGIPVFTPKNLKQPFEQAQFRALNADCAVVVAYGLLLPKAILEAPRFGCYNIHESLLPRWRGAAPIHRAIMAGDEKTGVMIMKMDEGLDTGAIALTAELPLATLTVQQAHDQLSEMGAHLIIKAMEKLERDELLLTNQPEKGVTYARKIEKSESRIDWNKNASEILNLIRALPAWFEIEDHNQIFRIKVNEAIKISQSGKPAEILDSQFTIACGEEAIRLIELQKAGSKSMSVDEFLRGTPLSKHAKII